VRAVYSGHDHNNNFVGVLRGVRLAYGYGGPLVVLCHVVLWLCPDLRLLFHPVRACAGKCPLPVWWCWCSKARPADGPAAMRGSPSRAPPASPRMHSLLNGRAHLNRICEGMVAKQLCCTCEQSVFQSSTQRLVFGQLLHAPQLVLCLQGLDTLSTSLARRTPAWPLGVEALGTSYVSIGAARARVSRARVAHPCKANYSAVQHCTAMCLLLHTAGAQPEHIDSVRRWRVRRQKSGYGSYGPPPGWLRGARVVQLKQGQTTRRSRTWVRQEDGSVLHQERAVKPRWSKQLICWPGGFLDIVAQAAASRGVWDVV
jgi:hypothetical protein